METDPKNEETDPNKRGNRSTNWEFTIFFENRKRTQKMRKWTQKKRKPINKLRIKTFSENRKRTQKMRKRTQKKRKPINKMRI